MSSPSGFAAIRNVLLGRPASLLSIVVVHRHYGFCVRKRIHSTHHAGTLTERPVIWLPGTLYQILDYIRWPVLTILLHPVFSYSLGVSPKTLVRADSIRIDYTNFVGVLEGAFATMEDVLTVIT